MIKIKLNDIISNTENLKALQEVKLPIKISYRLMRLVNKLEPILKSYDEKRNELVRKFGDKEDEKGVIKVTDPEKLKLFSGEFSELLNLEEEIDFDVIKVEDLGNVELPAKLLISWIFE